MKSFASKEDDLYEEERKSALEQAKERDLKQRSAIPGLVRPVEVALNGNGRNFL